ncbi:MAG: SURF1 family cytochrome oxidase biogenesis protein [Nocardioidaceae bacterium]
MVRRYRGGAVLRFLLTRRWIGLILAVLVVATACVLLGRWQFGRYDDRQHRNDTTEANLAAAPVPVQQVMATDHPTDEADEWRRVEATGVYDTSEQLTVLYRTRDGASGVDVVVPLVLDDGAALLVDRGWVPTARSGSAEADVPPPPGGRVTVRGWVRLDAEGDGTEPNDGQVRAISSAAIEPSLPYDLLVGFLDLQEENPSASPAPEVADPPDLSGGPSFFYGLQWWFFGLLALGFLAYFARHEYHERTGAQQRADADGRRR